jgi:hypothetical protein
MIVLRVVFARGQFVRAPTHLTTSACSVAPPAIRSTVPALSDR